MIVLEWSKCAAPGSTHPFELEPAMGEEAQWIIVLTAHTFSLLEGHHERRDPWATSREVPKGSIGKPGSDLSFRC
jgi:hypothetical protein